MRSSTKTDLISTRLSRDKHEDTGENLEQLKHSSVRVKATTSLQRGAAGTASEKLSAAQGLKPGILFPQEGTQGVPTVLKSKCTL